MKKRIIAIAVMAIMMLGVFGLTACDFGGESLASYKAVKSTELQDYGNAKGAEGNYCENGLAAICKAVTDGKAAIEAATTKPAVTTAYNNAKGVIDAVKGDEDMTFLEEETETMIEFVQSQWSTASSFLSGYPILLKHLDENALFECTADKGEIFTPLTAYEQAAQNANVKPGGFIYWTPQELTEQAFIDIILKNGDNIVGYAIVEIYQLEFPLAYKARILKSAIFPKIEGEYQVITENQVKFIFEKIKGENTL